MFVGAFFASRPRARPVGALGIFACPTLERFPPPVTKLVVLLKKIWSNSYRDITLFFTILFFIVKCALMSV